MPNEFSYIDIPCRLCGMPAIAIYYMDQGCVCCPDPVQALCEQHIDKATPIGKMLLIARPAAVLLVDE